MNKILSFNEFYARLGQKNGLAYVFGIDMLNEGANENSSYLIKYSNMNSQDKKSRGKGGKTVKKRRLREEKHPARIKD